MTEKRYLVYTICNGNVNASIEYGDHTTGEGKSKPNPNELKRIEVQSFDSEDLKILKIKYPMEENKNGRCSYRIEKVLY